MDTKTTHQELRHDEPLLNLGPIPLALEYLILLVQLICPAHLIIRKTHL
jgi:hypothetical protein